VVGGTGRHIDGLVGPDTADSADVRPADLERRIQSAYLRNDWLAVVADPAAELLRRQRRS
jgi:hypothetical protein